MRIQRALSVSLLMLNVLMPITAKTQTEFPQPKGWVNDFANVISQKAKQRLTSLCADVEQKTHAQIAVVTIESTERTPIDDYAHSLFNHWGIGQKGDNRGVLILLSVSDRKYRIETGRGLETLFPNKRVAEIGTEMVPDLKQQRYSNAVLHAVNEIATIIAKERGVTLTPLDRDPAP